MSDEALLIAEKKKRSERQRRRKRYTHLNAEYQRIGRRDKKDFLSEQHKETEENNRMEKTRDLFKKIGDTKGIFHAKIGTIKDRNESMNVVKLQDIKSTHRNPLHSYTLIMRKQKEKLRKQFHSPLQ